MPIKHQDFIIQGMFRDTSEHAFDSKFAYENQNLRITTEPNSDSKHTGDMYALTNEKGNKYTPIYGLDNTGHNSEDSIGDMWGIPIGQTVLNNYWVVFMVDRPEEIIIDGVERWTPDLEYKDFAINDLKVKSLDRIYKLWLNDDKLYGDLLYEGHLNFDYQNPIEALPSYENEEIQKVYWTDGLNQPRFINIVEKQEKRAKWNDTSFDFISTLSLNENVEVIPNDSGGKFPAGRIQWYFTYSKQFGQETNIFSSTDLYDIKFPDRGASPEEQTNQSFTLTINNLDDQFDFIHIYSVIRTSLDNTPICKEVIKINIKGLESVTYTDTNLSGSTIEPQSLFYKGGEKISAYTMEQKDNTLFMGNYKLLRDYIPLSIRNSFKNYAENHFKFTNGKDVWGDNIEDWLENGITLNSLYGYDYTSGLGHGVSDAQKTFRTSLVDVNNIQSFEKKTYFRKGNTYRIGIQFQHESGKWSEAVWLGDYDCNENMEPIEYFNDGLYGIPLGYLKLSNELTYSLQTLVDSGYRKIRPLVVYPKKAERKVLFQGVLGSCIKEDFGGEYETDYNKIYPDYFLRFLDLTIPDDYINISSITSRSRGYYSKVCSYNPNIHGRPNWFLNEYTAVERLKSSTVSIELAKHIYSVYSPDLELDEFYKLYQYSTENTLVQVDYIKAFIPYYTFEVETSSISKPKLGHWGWWKKRSPFFYDYFYNKDIEINVDGIGYKGIDVYKESKTIQDEEDSNKTKTKYVSRIAGYGYRGWSTRSVDPVVFTRATEDNPDHFYSTSIYPPRLNGLKNPTVYINHHYVGGYIWYDTLQNISITHSDLLGDVPTRSGSFMQFYFNYVFPVTIWQPSGSICYDNSEKASSVLKSNKTLNYLKTERHWGINNINNIQIKNAVACYGDNIVKLKNKWFCSNNINTILSFSVPYSAYVLESFKGDYSEFIPQQIKNSPNNTYSISNNSIGLKYLYQTEIAENESEYDSSYLPYDELTEDSEEFKWHNATKLHDVTIDFKYKSTPTLYVELGENGTNQLYSREANIPIVNIEQPINKESLFGGKEDYIIQSNQFLVCGKAVSIANKTNNKYTAKTDIELVWENGDTHLQNYEFIKTYPQTLQDENCITEVVKVMIESYVNLNGRYDKNIGNPNFGTLPSNWNLMNPIYNQQDNFMIYHGLDLSKNSINSYPNSFTWTLTKWAGDEIDKWTQVTMVSTMDVDGSKGCVTKLINWKDTLLCLQPKGVSQVLYNEREQIATGSGVPVELSNSGKVNGIRYFTTLNGCNNKWTVTTSEKALYWIDDVNKQIIMWNGQPNNISDAMGFHSWINEKSNLLWWNPLTFNNMVSYYDPYNENVMFIYKDNCLSYNEQIGCFGSFLSYGYVPYYMPLGTTAYMLSDRDSNGRDTYKVWEMFKGDYNYFFVHDKCKYIAHDVYLKGRLDSENKPTEFGYEPYWTTLLVNPDMPYDKVFNNMDIRTDMWSKNGELLEETFSHIETWNEFQWNKSQLIRNIDIPKVHLPAQHSILKKKFRVWYINIPRDIKQSNPRLRYYNRDRMRNTWLYIKLSKELINNDPLIEYPYSSDNKHLIHHLGVSYFV